MSVTTTSGRCASTASSNAPRSPHAPTTSIPARVASNSPSPSRKMKLSSATITRVTAANLRRKRPHPAWKSPAPPHAGVRRCPPAPPLRGSQAVAPALTAPARGSDSPLIETGLLSLKGRRASSRPRLVPRERLVRQLAGSARHPRCASHRSGRLRKDDADLGVGGPRRPPLCVGHLGRGRQRPDDSALGHRARARRRRAARLGGLRGPVLKARGRRDGGAPAPREGSERQRAALRPGARRRAHAEGCLPLDGR